jgi:DmsE family decaheme c-type cytochrome
LLRAIVFCAWFACLTGGTAALAAENPAIEAALKRDAICTRCHDETEKAPVLSIYQTRHGVKADERTPACQSCHGESELHVANPKGLDPRPPTDIPFGHRADFSPERQTQACFACHKSGQRAHWAGSEHERRDVACTSCHQIHARNDRVLAKSTQMEVCFGCHKTQRAQIHRISTHPLLVGKMACSDCHNPHGSMGPYLMTRHSVNETCYTCHAERRGPFLWEHSPVSEACTNCHTPHGSNNAPLLVTRTPWLCQQCHTADHSRDVNSAANLPNGALTTVNGMLPLANQNPRVQMNGRNCVACHSQVHGSNHPAGARFNR